MLGATRGHGQEEELRQMTDGSSRRASRARAAAERSSDCVEAEVPASWKIRPQGPEKPHQAPSGHFGLLVCSFPARLPWAGRGPDVCVSPNAQAEISPGVVEFTGLNRK